MGVKSTEFKLAKFSICFRLRSKWMAYYTSNIHTNMWIVKQFYGTKWFSNMLTFSKKIVDSEFIFEKIDNTHKCNVT